MKVLRREAGRPTCPFCHERFGIFDETRACERCGTVHHEECTREVSGCTIMGCGGTFPRAPLERRGAKRPVAVSARVAATTSDWNVGCLGILWGCLEVANVILQVLFIFV